LRSFLVGNEFAQLCPCASEDIHDVILQVLLLRNVRHSARNHIQSVASDRSRFDSNVGEPGGEKEDALFRRVSSVFDCIDSGVSSKEDGEDEMLLFGIF